MNTKQLKLKNKILELDRIVLADRQIDSPIKKVVVLMNLLGFPTFFSCGGHCSKNRIVIPYVMGRANNKPEHRFVEERKLLNQIAKKYRVNFNEVYHLGRIQTKYEKEFWLEIARLHSDETGQYKLWVEKNNALATKLEHAVELFNRERVNISDEFRLFVDRMNDCYRLQFKGEDKWFEAIEKTGYRPSNRTHCTQRLLTLRKEIKAFDERFLENNYYLTK